MDDPYVVGLRRRGAAAASTFTTSPSLSRRAVSVQMLP